MGDTTHPPSLPKIPNAPARQLSPHLTLQPPLSRRGNGPGLVLVVDHYALLEESTDHIDPPPLLKWAEEGYAVVQIMVPGKVDDGGEFPLEKALEALRGCSECIFGEGVGMISYLSRIPFYVEEAACLSPHIRALISYGGRRFTSIASSSTLPPQLVHIAGPEMPRRASMSVVTDPTSPPAPSEGPVTTYRYLEASRDTNWMLPSDSAYMPQPASLAHSRSLAFIKPLLKGPYFDLSAIWDEHCAYEFGTRNVADTMATMVAQPYVNHIPTMTGGIGQTRLTAFYTNHFIHSNPDDTSLLLVSRTVGHDRVVDEFVFRLTHDRQVDWLLPGVPPTGRFLEIPFTSVVAMRGDRLCHEHIHWDQATALRQAGLLPEWTTFPYHIDGRQPADGKRFEIRVPTAGVETARKLVDEGAVASNLLMKGEWREVDDV